MCLQKAQPCLYTHALGRMSEGSTRFNKMPAFVITFHFKFSFTGEYLLNILLRYVFLKLCVTNGRARRKMVAPVAILGW